MERKVGHETGLRPGMRVILTGESGDGWVLLEVCVGGYVWSDGGGGFV